MSDAEIKAKERILDNLTKVLTPICPMTHFSIIDTKKSFLYNDKDPIFEINITNKIDIYPLFKKFKKSYVIQDVSRQLCSIFGYDSPLVESIIQDILCNMKKFSSNGYWQSINNMKNKIAYGDVWQLIKYTDNARQYKQTLATTFVSSHMGINRIQPMTASIQLILMPDKDFFIKSFIAVQVPFGNDWNSWYLINPNNTEFFYYLRDVNPVLKYEDILNVSIKVPKDNFAAHLESTTYSRIVPIVKKNYGISQAEARALPYEDIERYLTLFLMKYV